MQRPRNSCFLTQSAVKLELQNPSQEIPCIRRVGRNVIFRAWIKIRFRPLHRWRNALIFSPQLPPCFVVIRRLHLPRKNFPAPFVHQQTKREERHFLQRLLKQVINIARGWRHSLDQPDFLQILRRDRKRDGIAHRFVKPIIRAALKQPRLIHVRALIKVVPQFVVNDPKILFANLNAHLDPQIFFEIHVPGARVAHHVPVRRFGKERPFPKRSRQRRKSQRCKEILAVLHHAPRIGLPLLQNLRQVVTLLRLWRIHQRINVVPLLAPDISQQMRRDRPVRRDQFISILLAKLPAHIRVQRQI